MKRLVMGNEAIALGALAAGAGFVAGYPGTPSTEILEYAAKYKPDGAYVEWSVNEKAALEVAAGAAYAGAYSLVTMKQVGLNVASDPLMSLAYVGVKGALVVAVADDPGPISSQTEQDTRRFAGFAKLPVFDPSTVAEAYSLIGEAFAVSHKYGTPVIFRPTTRVCHAYETLDAPEADALRPVAPAGFEKSPRWVIFPRLSYESHIKIEARNRALTDEFSTQPYNFIVPRSVSADAVQAAPRGTRRFGVAAGGVSYAYLRGAYLQCEPLSGCDNLPTLKVGTPHPFPDALALEFLRELDEVLVLEELDPVIETALTYLCGRHHLNVRIRGKLTGDMPHAGEYGADMIAAAVRRFIDGADTDMDNAGTTACTTGTKNQNRSDSTAYAAGAKSPSAPDSNIHTRASDTKNPINASSPPAGAACPVRPPVLCAGCPHRASFYAVKRATAGLKAVFCGDIGCYTLGNAAPLDMTDTCLCMGADVTIAQGISRAEPDTTAFAFIGDSTFFASGMTGVANAVYNGADIVLVVLDNHTTAMTGGQPHPGTGFSVTGEVATKISIEAVLRALGVAVIEKADPLDHAAAVGAVKRAADARGVRAIIFESPCVTLLRGAKPLEVDAQRCRNCRRCVRELGCPAVMTLDGTVRISAGLCVGCGLCAQICPFDAITAGTAGRVNPKGDR